VPVMMPKRRAHHVLDSACLAVGEFYLDPLPTWARLRAWTPRHGCSGRRWLGPRAFGFRLYRFPIPLRIVEMVVRFHKVVDREIVLAIVKPCTATDDLFEFDHRVDRAHQHDIADVAGVDAGGEFLRGREDSRDGLFVVLKITQVLLPQLAVVGRRPVVQ
jgi:hypothetical protein